jgi:hypothetical protein
MDATRRFTAAAVPGARGHLVVPVPFDPDAEWGPKPRHLVGGTVGGIRVRGTVEPSPDGHRLALGPAWARDCHLAEGAPVDVVLYPEGPQRADLDDDVAAALDASPAAGAFFDGLAQFYRKAYLKWLDGARRRPDLRAARLAELVQLLEAGVKTRPKP